MLHGCPAQKKTQSCCFIQSLNELFVSKINIFFNFQGIWSVTRCLSPFSASITEYHRLRIINNTSLFGSVFFRLEVQDPDCIWSPWCAAFSHCGRHPLVKQVCKRGQERPAPTFLINPLSQKHTHSHHNVINPLMRTLLSQSNHLLKVSHLSTLLL